MEGHLFTLMPSGYTGVHFANRVEDTPEMNVFTYRNFYNGGGVATADLNGDGLPEIILTSNLKGPRLYLNKGNFRFQDITDAAGIGGEGYWATGVTVADVNGDGRLDIYVCYAGNIPGKRRANELFINQGQDANGIPTFKEMAAEYGIAEEGYSTQAAFFDYDHDGNLDLFLINNSFRRAHSSVRTLVTTYHPPPAPTASAIADTMIASAAYSIACPPRICARVAPSNFRRTAS